MTGSGTATAKLENMGDQGAMRAEKSCGVDTCQRLRVAALGAENLCCDHFLARCYELLRTIDPETTMTAFPSAPPAEIRQTMEECSRRALEVSLGTPGLNNLQRARLLDILLWAGDISSRAHSRNKNPWGLATRPPKPGEWRSSISL